ncbi:MAG: UDP-N-acetylglucosamine 2-epimerase (non-hydrolyzing) [candidate division Zixibacteria bacterium]|nr:UDP-N-acetylglucosamine 2-epimerase (non-hydrolyzing) [candidate division Zixibacteria bacterium]
MESGIVRGGFPLELARAIRYYWHTMKRRSRIVSIVGARPQFIKLACLEPVLSKRFRHEIIHTGQHYDSNMSSMFFKQLRLPKANINLKIGSGSHGVMTGRMLAAIEKTLVREKPDLVLVYGDTNTTLAGALSAAKLSIPVGHVEAGMRSFVTDMPEEINRRLTDHVSTLLFCPTAASMKNARAEGIRKGLVHSGDLMYELLHNSMPAIRRNRSLLRRLGVEAERFLLLTAHRAANVDDRRQLLKLLDLIEALPMPTLFPVHPRTKKRLRQFRLWSKLSDIDGLILCDPLGYFDMLTAAHFAHAVLSDSGGLQKEAIFLGTPVLTLRDETEWVETLRRGNHLVGLDAQKVCRLLARDLGASPLPYRVRNKRPSRIIADHIARCLAGR